MNPMRVIFMGTPAFAVPSLAGLIAAGHEIVCVYTQPPRPSGRGHKLHLSPVQKFAEEHSIAVRHPLNFKAKEDKRDFAALNADIAIVVAYGLILPKAILEAPRRGCLNLHGSLLPRWRGAAPIQRAIMAGDPISGIQVMEMEKGLDTGAVFLSETVTIQGNDTAGSLSDRLSHIGAELLPRALAALSRDALVPKPQSEEGITYAHKINTDDARIAWQQPAACVDAHIRGLNPVPGAWTMMPQDDDAQARLKIWFSSVPSTVKTEGVPGQIIKTGTSGINVLCGDGHFVRLEKLQRPGKAAQLAEDFLRGWPMPLGTVLA